MTPDPPLPRGTRSPYVQWGDCNKCGARFPMTERMVNKADPSFTPHWEKPSCSKCRRKVTKSKAKRRAKKLDRPACSLAGKVSPAKMKKMHLRQAPASGVPRFCSLTHRFFVNYFIGTSRALVDEERAYLDAKTVDEAADEARDWYTRALLNGAKWLPDDFQAGKGVSPEVERTWKILRMLRRRGRRKRPPRQVRIKKRRVRVWVDRWCVSYNNKIVSPDIHTHAAAASFAASLRRRTQQKAKDPVPLACKKCGVRAVWMGAGVLIHEGDDYCANMMILRDKRFTRLTKIALWNQVLRHGEFSGWGDFRFEHILMMDKIKKVIPERPVAPLGPLPADPLEGFEI